MSKPRLILIGAGGHARSCIEVIEQHGRYEIAGLVGTREETSCKHFGYPVIATDDELPRLARDVRYAIVAVGQIHSPGTRIRLYQHAIELGFRLPQIVAPTAHVSAHARIGAGSIVMHGVVVNANARVGKNCIINSRAIVEHDATVEDHCHISTGAILNGSVHVGSGTFVGSGAVIRDGITLGTSCVVGMGVCLRHDQPDNTRYTGDDKS